MKIHLSVVLAPLLAAGLTWGATQSEKQNKPAPALQESRQQQPAAAGTSSDRSRAYYHYSLGHLYEEMGGAYNEQDYIQKAIDNYKLALQYDPGSSFLSGELADLYARLGRTREAVAEAEEVVKRDPNNIEARKMLGRVYFRLLREPGSKLQSDTLKRAIEQYEKIIAVDAKDIDSLVTLGQLYRVNNDFSKSETVLKQALAIQPDNEDALTMLAFLYTDTSQFQSAIELLEKVTAKNQNPRLLAVLGNAYEQAHQPEKAVIAFRKALDLDKDNPEYLRSLGQNLMASEQFDDAVKTYKDLAASDPADENAFLRLGQIYRQMGRYNEAAENLQKAATLNPANLEAPFEQALLAEARGRNDEAAGILKGLLDRTAKKDGAAYSDREKANRAIFFERLGQIYRSSANYTAAEEAFRQMMDADQENAVRGASQLVETYQQARQPQRAVAEAEAAVKRFPDDRGLKVLYARLLAEGGQVDEANQLLRGLLKDTPEDRDVLAVLVETYRQAKQPQRALAEAEGAVKRFPGDRGLKVLYANLIADNGQVDEANKLLRGMLQNKPQDREVLLAAAQLNERLKRYPAAEQAVADAEKYAEKKDEKETLYYIWGSILERQKKYDEAEVQFKKGLAANPNSAGILNYFGYMLADRGVRLEEAKKYIEQALTVEPGKGEYLDSLGWVYFKMNRLKEAEQYLLKAIEKIDKDATIFDHLGDVYFQGGRLRDALQQWQQALAAAQKASPEETEGVDVAKIQKKVETVRVRLAQQTK